MKIKLLPLYSQCNSGIDTCPLACQTTCQAKQANLKWKHNFDNTCPLSTHQAQTYHQIIHSDAEIIFNTSATGDGKSLAGYLPSLLSTNKPYRTLSLYPTNELIADQNRQLTNTENGYLQQFTTSTEIKVDTWYGTELSRKIAQKQDKKKSKFQELIRCFKQHGIILTNPDIFHLIIHYQYYDPAYNPQLLVSALSTYPNLYLLDEFHIFDSHQEMAVLNSLILIKNSRQKKNPLKVLFTSATPKPSFIEQLEKAGFKISKVQGNYQSQPAENYRQIIQAVDLDFINLEGENSLSWLTENSQLINHYLQQEKQGRGLIILNSISLVNQVVQKLQTLLPHVEVREISGRIDRQEREINQRQLAQSQKPVLIVATSAVDVGVDFKIHLLIFEVSNSATFIQRLGRLGRHQGFSHYQAFALIPEWMKWVTQQLETKLKEEESIDRNLFRTEIIETIFSTPQDHSDYRNYWGALQAQGLLDRLSGKSLKTGVKTSERNEIALSLIEKITPNLLQVYGDKLHKKRGHWYTLGKEETGRKIQEELLRFRGGTTLQCAVWDNTRFYTYDLLRLLPYTEIEVINREEFLQSAQNQNYSNYDFPENYITLYLKVKKWVDTPYKLTLNCELGTDELDHHTLTLIDELTVEGHPQKSELRKPLKKQKHLSFLIPLPRKKPDLFSIKNTLHLGPYFGLYFLEDADNQPYACAFNQDALLLESLKWKLSRCKDTKPYIF